MFKEGSEQMQVIIGVIGVLGGAVVILLLSALDISGGVKAVIIPVVVLIAVYSMARIQPKETRSEQDTEK